MDEVWNFAWLTSPTDSPIPLYFCFIFSPFFPSSLIIIWSRKLPKAKTQETERKRWKVDPQLVNSEMDLLPKV